MNLGSSISCFVWRFARVRPRILLARTLDDQMFPRGDLLGASRLGPAYIRRRNSCRITEETEATRLVDGLVHRDELQLWRHWNFKKPKTNIG